MGAIEEEVVRHRWYWTVGRTLRFTGGPVARTE